MSRFVTNVPVPLPPAHLPDIQAVESPMNGTGTGTGTGPGFSDANFAFLDRNHATSNSEPMDVVRLPEQQSSSAYRPWPSTHPNSSMLNSIPLPQQKIISKSGVAVPIAITPPLDYTLLLLSLAEDYFAVAHGEGSLVGLRQGKGEMQTYYGLIATGLGCLEAVLKRFRLQPRLEAEVRLRYATVLHDETENVMEAEEALSKGIIICDRHKFFDVKYNMQHLLARVLFKQNSRASLKYLDGIINDVEAYQHIAWVYAFRFLRVFLALELSTHLDTLAAITHLKLISDISNRHGDKAILTMATTLEAMTHLRQSNSTENIEQAQRALAVARSQQLDPAVASLPQLATLMQCVDLCSTLQRLDPAQAMSKMHALQAMLEGLPEGQSLIEEGSFAISIAHTGFSVTKTSIGVVRSMSDGRTELIFNWLPKADIYALGCLLSGIAITHRNTTDGQKAEQMLREGLRSQDKMIKKTNAIPHSIELTAARNVWRQVLKCHMQLQLTFALCIRTVWREAQDQLRQLQETTSNLPPEIADTLNLQILYLSGVIYQGTGDLAAALSIFQSSSFALPSETYSPLSPLHLDLSILAALNTLLIIRAPTHPSNHLLPSILTSLLPLCATNSNKALLAAYHLLVATCSHTNTILHTKQHLQCALQAAKQSASNQLMCLTLNFMSWKFFKGVVGEQAEKSARASQALARKGADRLWESVANGVLADTLDVAARYGEANEVRLKGQEIAVGLPDVMREHGNTADRERCRGEPGVGMYGYYGGSQ